MDNFACQAELCDEKSIENEAKIYFRAAIQIHSENLKPLLKNCLEFSFKRRNMRFLNLISLQFKNL